MDMHGSARRQAETLVAAGKAEEALGLLRARAKAGDPEAVFTLGVWHATGEHLPRDLAAARILFEQAADAGVPQAATIHTNFLASGTGGPSRWGLAIERLRSLVQSDPRVRHQLALIDAMTIDGEGRPPSAPEGKVLSQSPDVWLFPRLFSAAECAYLALAAGPLLRPALVVDNDSGKRIRNPIRTSDGAIFTWPLEDPAIHALNRRIAAASGTKADQGEPLQVLRYRPGQEYRTHVDAIPGFDNQRVLTMLVYLNEDYEGGETQFVASGLAARGGTGDGLLFRNVDAEGRPDNCAAHAGLPVTRGVKLIASRWIRERRFEGQ